MVILAMRCILRGIKISEAVGSDGILDQVDEIPVFIQKNQGYTNHIVKSMGEHSQNQVFAIPIKDY